MPRTRARRLLLTSALGMLAVSANVVSAADVDTRIADAAMKRDVTAVRALIAQKVDVNAPGTDGTPALHWAVRVDDASMAKLLLGAGAQATVPNRYGLTP